MGSRNYLLNFEDMSLSDKKDYRLKALAAGLERCGVKGIGNVNADIPGLEGISEGNKAARVNHIAKFIATGAWPASIDQRELVTGPLRTDLVAATALDEMVTAPMAAVGAAYSCFQAIAGPQLLINRLVVFWGVSVETAPCPATYLLYRKGGVAGNVEAMFDFQTQNPRLAFDTFLSEAVVFDPQEVFAVQVVSRVATGILANIHLHNFLFGPAGQTIL